MVPDKYLLSGKNAMYQELEIVTTELLSYICGTEWNDDPTIQNKMNNNPIWDHDNNKQKAGTGYSIKYLMNIVFGEKGGLSKNWHKKPALYFTLNDQPVTYASHKTNNEQQCRGTHWFSMSVQQYHQEDKVINIDWNIFDSFNDKAIIRKFKDTHIIPIKNFLHYIYNEKLQFKINIPTKPKLIKYQTPQPSNDYFSCGIFCALPLNVLMKLTSIWKNQHKNDEDIKMSQIDQIEMKQGMDQVTTLRQLLTDNIKNEYQQFKKNIQSLPFTDIPLKKNQYINYKLKSDESTKNGTWKFGGKISEIAGQNENDKIRVVGIDLSNNNIVETKILTSNFFKNVSMENNE